MESVLKKKYKVTKNGIAADRASIKNQIGDIKDEVSLYSSPMTSSTLSFFPAPDLHYDKMVSMAGKVADKVMSPLPDTQVSEENSVNSFERLTNLAGLY